MRFHDNEEITNYVNLFVSVIICFPEITTIKYDRNGGDLYFTFILKNAKNKEETEASLQHIYKAYRSYYRLESRKNYDFSISRTPMREYAVLEAKRDMKTVTRAEIAFLVELFQNQFGDSLVIETVDPEEEDFRWLYRENDDGEGERKRIKFDEESIGNNILVCREAGKVLVFSNS